MHKTSSNPKTSSLVRSRIEKGEERLWRMEDLRDQPFPAVAQAFSRINRKGRLRRLSKGVDYHPRQTAFGPGRPSPTEIRQFTQRSKTIFPSGPSAANLLGFSTRAPKRGEVATSSLSLPRRLIGAEIRVHARRPRAWKSLSDTEAAILDVLLNGGKTSELSPGEATSILDLDKPGRGDSLRP